MSHLAETLLHLLAEAVAVVDFPLIEPSLDPVGHQILAERPDHVCIVLGVREIDFRMPRARLLLDQRHLAGFDAKALLEQAGKCRRTGGTDTDAILGQPVDEYDRMLARLRVDNRSGRAARLILERLHRGFHCGRLQFLAEAVCVERPPVVVDLDHLLSPMKRASRSRSRSPMMTLPVGNGTGPDLL